MKIMTLKQLVVLLMFGGSGAVFATDATMAPPPNQTGGTPTPTASLDWKPLAAALINYEASARMQEYMLNQNLLFMSAPATIWAIQAGEIVGGSNAASEALSLSDKSLLNSLGSLTKAQKVTIRGVEYVIPKDTVSPITYFDKLRSFFESGDPSNLAILNFASVIQSDNITKSSTTVTKEQAQLLVNTLSDPYPYLDPTIVTRLKSGKALTGEDMEQIGSRIASYAVIGVSAMAFSDIVARRIPSKDQPKSMMEVMDDASQERIKSKDWYNQIGAASEAALLREMVHMMAYNQWVAYEQYRISEQQVALLASMNGVMAKVNGQLDYLNRLLISTKAEAEASKSELQQRIEELKQR